jgi:hypothetical protein
MPREIYSIICDDIRSEEGHKISLIGVYTEGILVPRIPFTFPKLCLAQGFEDSSGVKTVKIRLVGPKIDIKVKTDNIADPTKSKLRLNIVVSPVTIEKEGDYRFETYFDEQPEPVAVKQFYIHLRPDVKVE